MIKKADGGAVGFFHGFAHKISLDSIYVTRIFRRLVSENFAEVSEIPLGCGLSLIFDKLRQELFAAIFVEKRCTRKLFVP